MVSRSRECHRPRHAEGERVCTSVVLALKSVMGRNSATMMSRATPATAKRTRRNKTVRPGTEVY
jgi:hypothetical protein